MKLVIGYNELIFIGYLELSFTDDRSKTWLSAVLDVIYFAFHRKTGALISITFSLLSMVRETVKVYLERSYAVRK